MTSTAILHAAQLVTLAGAKRARVGAEMAALGIIRDGGMLVRGDRIVAVGTSAEIERDLPNDAEIIEAAGCVVLPGFVDAHTHLVFAGDRLDDFERRSKGESYEQIGAAGGGILSTVRKTRAASEDQLFEQARKHAHWMLRNGTTTAETKSGYGLCLADELKILRVIRRINQDTPLQTVPTFLGAHAVPEECKGSPQKYVSTVIDEMLPKVAAENLAEFCDVFCERGYFDVEQSRELLAAAKKLGMQLRIHADQLSNGGGAKLAAELNAATADHLEQTEADGIAAMKAAGVQPVLLPGSVYGLGCSRYPRAREMIDAGLAVVVATDFNPGSSPTPSMPMVLSLACRLMKMSPAETIVASTINAAHSLGRSDSVGSLESGKRADFTVFECADFREIPYWFGSPPACSVYSGGVRVT